MNQREKLLAGCVAAVVVGYGGFKVIKAGVIEPGKRLQADIRREVADREKRQNQLAGVSSIIKGWQLATERTLHGDYKAAHDVFREDIAVLLDRNKLTEGRTISKYKERTEKKGPREGFIDLPISVRVEGKLADLVNFLRDLYQRPYMINVEKLNIAAELESKKSKKSKSASKEPKLKITMTLSTLVVPKIKDVEHKTFDMEALKDPERQEAMLASAAWLHQKDMSVYGQLLKPSPFEIWAPPLPRRQPKPTEVVRKDPKPELKPTPKPDPRRDADKYVLVGTASDGEPIAYVVNTDEIEPPAEYRLNDEVDGGKLVLVTWEGMVVRATEGVGRRKVTKNYFYARGENFKQRVEVKAGERPEIDRLLQLVLKR